MGLNFFFCFINPDCPGICSEVPYLGKKMPEEYNLFLPAYHI